MQENMYFITLSIYINFNIRYFHDATPNYRSRRYHYLFLYQKVKQVTENYFVMAATLEVFKFEN